MEVETSVHWHGLLLPNFYDGVPYLTTPPIQPGETFTYEFAIKQSGTYWYHSHTMLQEQAGVYGSIVIEPKEKQFDYDHDLVLVLSDWTNDKPMNILRNLKRGNEWFGIKKGTATPLNQVIGRGGLGAQINFWKQRMEGADIADIYYNAFLINGKSTIDYPKFKAGERIRLRFINAAASTYFWLTFGGDLPELVASDGMDVIPVKRNKTLISVSETYDFIVTIPENGKLEIRASAQDGSGSASAFIGNGPTLSAKVIPRPDKIDMMKKMAKMDMTMGAPALKFQPKKDERFELKQKYGMQMEDMEMMDSHKKHSHKHMKMHKQQEAMGTMQQENMDKEMAGKNMQHSENMPMDMYAAFNYDYLKSPNATEYDSTGEVKEILLNLTGNMNRYVWSLNGVPLSETDKIQIEEGKVTRITLNNLTMMHHPMHLHGHFFRLINKNGTHSPLKHVVNVPPMNSVTIEFLGNEYGDWFFHCHILYHMMGGMARIFSYDTPRDARMEDYPVSELIHETNIFYNWGTAEVASHMTGINLVASNLRNQFNLTAEFGYNKNMETEFTYDRYLNDFVRVFGGVNVENEVENSLDEISTTAIVGIKYFTPYMFDFEISIDNQLRPRVRLGRELMIFPRLSIFGNFEYESDFGFINDMEVGQSYASELVWNAGAEYMLSKNFSLMGSYDNRFGAGGGLSIRF
jgi:CopA family copper-resistance protein